ncbi:hypothetical protein AAC387_Pa01g1103 [Persea americana]
MSPQEYIYGMLIRFCFHLTQKEESKAPKDRSIDRFQKMRNEQHVADANVSESTKAVEVGIENPSYSSECGTESSEHEKAINSKDCGLDIPNETFVYREDVVRCNKPGGLVGIVSEVAGDLDSDSSMTDDDDDDDDKDIDDFSSGDGGVDDNNNVNDSDEGGTDKNDALQDGQVRVIWLDHSETICNLSDITVVDRGFLHGDIVADVSDPTGKVGIVVDVNVLVDLHAADGEVKGISSRHLQRIRDFTVGDYVIFGHWLGRVDDVLDNVTVLFDDGSTCKVMKADPSRLKPVSKDFLQDAHFPYYPGQRVRASSSSVFKNARWLSGVWKANRLEGTVIKVQTGSVFVYWVASASPGYGSGAASVPSEEQKPKNLKPLSCFAYANWQLGDWCMLPASPPVDEAISSDKYEDSSNACESNNKDSEDCLDKENNGSDVNSCTEVLGTALHDSEKIQYRTTETEGLKNTIAQEKLGGNCKSSLDSSMDLDGNCNTAAKSNHLIASSSCSGSLSISKEPIHESWPIHRKKIRKVVVKRDRKARRKSETFERAVLIVNTMTKVDVAWQDGTREFSRDSKSLIPVNSPGDHEFCPEQYVVEKPSSGEGDDSSEVRRVGVVKSANAKDRTACVRWLKPVARPEDPREFDKEEVVSVYELDEHPDYDYCYGDVVVRLSPVPVASDIPSYRDPTKELVQHAVPVQANGDQGSRVLPGCKIVEHRSQDDTDVNFSGLSWVGNITGLQDGDIEVTWADGMVSKVGPQAIYVVGRDDEDSVDGGSEVNDDDAASWETVEEHERDALENAEEESDLQNATGNNSVMAHGTSVHSEDNNPTRNGPLSFPLAAFGFVTRLATGLFNRGKRQLDQLASDSNVACESGLQETLETNESGIASNECTCQEPNTADYACLNATHETADAGEGITDHTSVKVERVDNKGRQISEESDVVGMGECYEDDCLSFKRFDITNDPVDSYYFGGGGKNINGGRKWVKKVQQDWSILEKNLPGGIYVRVYEDRMDLLRAVIVGAYGTPYQDGLFFFDFHLPPEYPQLPPSAYYHSGGLRLNPNLYEDGKVCLSLLNTWTGKGNEVWDPSSSSILQVLVSLQGLVLNSRPYFNEAGYDKQVGTAEGEKNSLSYNENTFLLSCKSMLYLLRRPPMHFEELVKQHFQRRGYYILKACNAYMDGCLVGSLTKDACRSDRSGKNSNSVGFKLMLAKIMPKLVTALSEVGADCKQFEHLQQL